MTPVALFAALARAVREGHLREQVRSAAFCGLERLAVRLNQPTFARELDQFVAFANEDTALAAIIHRFMPNLEALAGPWRRDSATRPAEQAASGVEPPRTAPDEASDSVVERP